MKSAEELLPARTKHAQWASLIELAGKEVFDRMLEADLERLPDRVSSFMDMTAMVGLAGQIRGLVSVRCNHEMAAHIAAKMLGDDTAPPPEDVQDAFGEVCNMVAGNFKNKVAGKNCTLSLPTVVVGSDYSLRSLQDTEAIEVAFVSDGRPIVITLTIHT